MSEDDKFGPINNYQRGKLNDDDGGEIRVGMYIRDKTLIVDFGVPVKWIGLDKGSALTLAIGILENVEKL